jgi:CTP:molybdopterin cytidylyltransferase MocA/HD superfamily phosphohydrolase YqeK
MKIGAVIVAAGMSSRMTDFKPLMKIGKYAMIEWSILRFKEAGVDDIVVVTGHNGDEIESQVKKWGISFVRNDNYQSTEMFDSIKLGIKYFKKSGWNKLIITPVDAPLVSHLTIKKLLKSKEEITIPIFEGKRGHPVVLGREGVAEIEGYTGPGGLKGAIASSSFLPDYIETKDSGVLNDIDTKKEYHKIVEAYHREGVRDYKLLGEEQVMEIWDRYQVLDDIREHMKVVAEVALDMAWKLEEVGVDLDPNLIYASAMFHDLCRTDPKHEERAAKEMEKLGYPQLVEVVKSHHSIRAEKELTEATILFLADKMVCGTSKVTIEERFKKSYLKCNTNEAKEAHESRKNYTIKMYQQYLALIA